MTIINLECRNLSIGWPKKVLIEDFDVNVDFKKLNRCLPIIGETGLGKSTLLYAISGMAEPIKGEIKWKLPSRRRDSDLEIFAWSAGSKKAFKPAQKARAREFGFLLQDAALIPCFTVEQNLVHAMRLRKVPGSRRDKLERIKHAVETMKTVKENPADLLRLFPSELSGGQRQRMALAVATVHDPPVLFADEPTASLDYDTGLRVLEAIRRWLDEPEGNGERVFVFVTHRIEVIGKGLAAPLMLQLQHLEKETDNSQAQPLQTNWLTVPGVVNKAEKPDEDKKP